MSTSKLIALATCSFVILLGPHLLGGATPGTAWVISICALVALCAAIWSAVEAERVRVIVPLAGAVLTLHMYTLIQALPLPCGVVDILAPGSAHATRELNRLTPDLPAQMCTLSFDHGATLWAVPWTSALLSMLVASSVLVQFGYRRDLIRAIAGSTVGMALVALAHRLMGATSVYGLYRPSYAHARLLAPIMNENHLGAFLAMGVPLTIALGLQRARPKPVRAAWFFCAALTGSVAMLTLSRGAVTMLAIELLVFGGFLLVRGPRMGLKKPAIAAMLSVMAVIVALGGYAAGHEVAEEFRTGGMDKLQLIAKAVRFVFRAPVFGHGRGAFGSAFAAAAGGLGRAEFAENLPVQWAADWGVPMAVLVLGWAGWWVARAMCNEDTTLGAACLTALGALVLQNLVDFSIDMTGIVVVVAPLFVVAVLPHRDDMQLPFPGLKRLAVPTSVRTGVLVAFSCLVALVWSAFAGTAMASFEDLYRQFQSRRPGHELLVRLERAARQHPTDARYAMLIASVQSSLGDKSTRAWVAYAQRLAPRWTGPHVLEAHRLLQTRDVDGAARELRLAANVDARSVADLSCRVATALVVAGRSPVVLLPGGRGAATVAEYLNGCNSLPFRVRDEIDERAAELAPEIWTTRYRLAVANAWRPRRVVELLEPLARNGTKAAVVYCLLADAFRAQGQAAIAESWLDRGLELSDDRYLIYSNMASGYGALHRFDEMRDMLAMMRVEAGNQPQRLADAYARQAQIEEAYGSPTEAIAAYERAFNLNHRVEWLGAIVRLAQKAGDNVKLARASADLCKRGEMSFCRPAASVSSVIGEQGP